MPARAQVKAERFGALLVCPAAGQVNYRIRPLHDDNWRVEEFGDLTVKDRYWVWPSHNCAGNAIDFFTAVEGKSFAQAMQILAA
jgi:hypothetical protein